MSGPKSDTELRFNHETGRRLRLWRERAGFTQEALGVEMGFTAPRQSVSNIEHGHQSLTIYRAALACEAIVITLDQLLNEEWEGFE